METFEWDDSIALGIASIDEQHKALFGWLNSLNDAIRNGEGSEAVGNVISNLITYVTEHFNEEERMMLSCSYPGLPAHRNEHDKFVSRLQEIQVDFIDGHELGNNMLEFLVDWLVRHIKGTDQGYNQFIRHQQKS